MPLTNAQKEFIRYGIEHLLEFPADNEELKTGIQQLNTWLLSPPEQPDQNNIFYALSCYLRSPESTLQHLEDYGKNITPADVQQYLLALISDALEAAANKNEKTKEDLGWSTTSIQSILSETQKTTAFNSVKTDFHITLPWENVHEDGQTFTYSLSLRDAGVYVLLSVDVTIPENNATEKTLECYAETPIVDYDEYYLLSGLVKIAKSRAMDIAVISAFHYLDFKNLIPEEYSINKEYTNRHHHLLVETDILTLILEKKMTLTEIAALSPETVKKLSHPVAKQFLHLGICTLKTIDEVSIDILDILKSYSSLINNDDFDIRHFMTLNSAQQKNMRHPVIINLIHAKKLPINIAVKLPACMSTLVTSSLYADYFFKATINWNKMLRLSPSRVSILLSPPIANCIKQNTIKLDNILYSKKKRRKKLLLYKVQHLMAINVLSLRQVDKTSMKKCEMIQSHPLLCEWLAQAIINYNNLIIRSLTSLYFTVYANRLTALFNRKPFTIHNQPDTTERMIYEFTAAEYHAEADASTLQSQVIIHLLKIIKNQMKVSTVKYNLVKERTFYLELCRVIDAINQQHASPCDMLAEIISIADTLNAKRKFNLKLFSSTQRNNDEFNILCENLHRVSALSNPVNETVKSRMTARVS